MNNSTLTMTDDCSVDSVILSCRHLSKRFHDGTLDVNVLSNINFEARKGESIAILGKSGSGKSTFLQLLGGLDKPTTGEVLLQGKSLQRLSESERCELRNRFLGFVYQFHHLLPEFSALENVAMPLLLNRLSIAESKERARALLEKVGLGKRVEHRLSELSGGERQRVAIARALVNNPLCVMADEPTGNLDLHTANEVFDLMRCLKEEMGTTLIIVTHDLAIANKMERQLVMEDGILIERK
jgi:lipoprotein-releasing system ATP-binding protein